MPLLKLAVATASAPLLIFIVTYLLIAVQPVRFLHLNRPAASLLGAVAMVVLGGLPLDEAYAAIDLDVLVFLLGLMILVGYLEEGGFFEVAAEWLLERVTTPRKLLVGVVLGSGVLSALFVNDTICLVVTPVLVATLGSLGIRPAPYLIALAMGANVGSVLAFTGNPQNMLIGLWSGIPFARFSLHMLPVFAGALLLTCAVLLVIYWRELSGPFPRRAELPPVTFDRPLVRTALLLFAGAVAGWLLGGSLPLVAITAGALMVAFAGRDPTPALARVEWSLLLLFGALFVVMRGLERSGAVGFISAEGTQVISLGGPWTSALAVSGVMLTLSNLISNVPAVILWRHVVPRLPHPELIWQLMAMSATFAGNLLMIGSAANLIVAERAEARGVKLRYGEYARAGVPVTLVTMAWGIVTLVLLASR